MGYAFLADVRTYPEPPPAQPGHPCFSPTHLKWLVAGLKLTADSRAVYAAFVGAGWPLVGRAEELDEVCRHVLIGQTSGVLVAGAAGVGKSRLAREASDRAGGHGFATEWVGATRSAIAVPLAAFAHLLPGGELGGMERIDLFRRVSATLRQRSQGQPVVLAVDDAHLLDDAAAALVLHLATTGAARVLVTLRTGSDPPDAVVALWKDGVVARVELQPLGQSDTAKLLQEVLGSQVDSESARRLWTVTKGNALFLRELVDDLVRDGALVEEQGLWRWDGAIQPGARLSELVHIRLGRLDATRRAALELLATGEPLEAAMFAELEPTAVIAELEHEGVVSIERAGRRAEARLGHPLYGEVLRATMPRTRWTALCLCLAEAMDASELRRAHDIMRLALWRIEAGAATDPAVLTHAGVQANAMFDHGLAERFARAALAQRYDAAAGLVLGDALGAQGRHREAESVFAAVGDAADDATRAHRAYQHAVSIQYGRGHADDALAVLTAAEDNVQDEVWRGFLRAERATVLAHAGRVAEAADLVSPLLGAPDTDDKVRLRALGAVGRPWALSGQTASAIAGAESLIEPAFRLRHELPRALGWVCNVWIIGLLMAGRLDQAGWLIARLEDAAAADPNSRAPDLALLQARLALLRGQPATAAAVLAEVSAALRRHDPQSRRPWALALLSEARALLGDVAAARAALVDGDAAANPALRLFSADVARARAWVMAAAGELSEARAQAGRAAHDCRAHGEYGVEMMALHDALRLGDDGVAERLQELAPLVDGAWSGAFADHATALVADDGHALDAVRSTFEEIGAIGLAAEAAAEASAAYRRAGLSARANAASTRSAVLLAACEGSRTPALAALDSALSTLSSREAEIAAMAARGLSNRDIADQLVVSIRTVEGHLYRLYGKLGVGDREALTRLLRAPSQNA